MALGETARLLAELDLDDKFSGKLGRAGGALSGFQSRFSQVNRGIGQVAGGLDRLATRGALAAAGGLTAVITTAASMEEAFTGIRKTVDETASISFEDLRAQLRGISSDTGTAFEELSRIGEIGGALGIGIESLDEFIDVVNRLSVSTDLTAETASTALGQLGTILHLEGEDLRTFSDSLVALGNAGASTEPQIVDIAARFAAAGNAAGLSVNEILALASATASMGIEAEAGGTALSRVFNNVSTNIGTSSAKAQAFADALGLSASEFRTAWDRDALGTLQDFLEELNKLDQFEQASLLQKVGITNVRDVATVRLMAQNFGFLGEQLDVAANSQGALNAESDKFFGTSAANFRKLRENVRLAADSFGVELLPVTNELITDFVKFVNLDTSQTGIKDFAKGLAEGIRGVVKELRGTDFSGLIGGMKLAAEVAKGAFDAFRALPAPIQQLAIAALVANKVSGGAVGQIAKGLGNIAGGLLTGGGLLGRGASPANPLWVQMVGGVPGAGGPGGVAGGRGGLIAGTVGTLGVLAAFEGGIVSLQDITSGTEKGIIKGAAAIASGPGGLIGAALEGPINDLIAALGFNTSALQSSTPLGQFNPANLGGTPTPTKPIPVAIKEGGLPKLVQDFMAGGLAGIFKPKLPNTAADAGGGVVELPDTALSSLDEIATNTRPLAPIISKAEQASQTTARAVQDAKLAQIAGLNRLGEPIRTLASRTEAGTQTLAARMGELRAATVSSGANVAGTIRAKNFSPNISVRVTSNIAITDITRRLVSARVSTGTISEF